MSAVVSIKRHPANSRWVALPHLPANSTGLPSFVRILCILPRLPPPHSPPPQSIKMQRCTPTSPTAHMCVFPQTDQSSDPFITWAAEIILRHRSFILSINSIAFLHERSAKRQVQHSLQVTIEVVCWHQVLRGHADLRDKGSLLPAHHISTSLPHTGHDLPASLPQM